jgi:hypothetical protein
MPFHRFSSFLFPSPAPRHLPRRWLIFSLMRSQNNEGIRFFRWTFQRKCGSCYVAEDAAHGTELKKEKPVRAEAEEDQ